MRKVLLMLGLLGISACTTTEKMDWTAIGGSKAGGNITLGIEVPPKMGISETIVQWDVEQANAEADRRCRNWSYAGAEMYQEGQFPVQMICHPQGMSPCWRKTYRIEYQCIDKK